tara:strand:- start:817 stop:1647 length:831 start_codon:yes stop_codon:yes gene_type:complete
LRVDAHQHFWNYDSVEYDWIDESMVVLKRDYLPSQLGPLLKGNTFDGCVAVQARQTEEETEYLLQLANQNDFIKGVVGWVDLCDSNVVDRLANFSQSKKLCGIRHIVQDEPDDNFMLREDFQQGVSVLVDFDLAYDILIFPKHLAPAFELIRNFPDQRFVIDHIAKPYIKDGKIEDWQLGMDRLSRLPNVYCKVSGLVTEAIWDGWEPADFTPYLDLVFSSFGIERLLIGSDWPVCLLGGDYKTVMDIVTNYISNFSSEDQEKIMGLNATEFYKLN